jgi:4'-phosphopantetheinyl transferase
MHISADSTHVWLLACRQSPEVLDELLSVLDAEERRRADRYRFEADRNRFIASRGALREVLAAYLQCAPRDVLFSLAEHGKPHLAEPCDRSLRFNLSTSGDWAMLAVTLGREVGVDVERINSERADRGIVSYYFAPGEIQALEAMDEADWLQGFFNCWTRKEAFIKATGEGLSRPLDSFEVSLQPGQPASLISFQGCRQAAKRWRMAELAEVPGYASALVVAGSIGQIHSFIWTPS